MLCLLFLPFEEGAGFNVPNLTATGVLLALATFVIRSMLTRSEVESKAYRDLLAQLLEHLRSDLKDSTDKVNELVNSLRDATDAQRAMSLEMNRLSMIAQRIDRMLVHRGFRDVGEEVGRPSRRRERTPVVEEDPPDT
mgnify:CR=1 FL=1